MCQKQHELSEIANQTGADISGAGEQPNQLSYSRIQRDRAERKGRASRETISRSSRYIKGTQEATAFELWGEIAHF